MRSILGEMNSAFSCAVTRVILKVREVERTSVHFCGILNTDTPSYYFYGPRKHFLSSALGNFHIAWPCPLKHVEQGRNSCPLCGFCTLF